LNGDIYNDNYKLSFFNNIKYSSKFLEIAKVTNSGLYSTLEFNINKTATDKEPIAKGTLSWTPSAFYQHNNSPQKNNNSSQKNNRKQNIEGTFISDRERGSKFGTRKTNRINIKFTPTDNAQQGIDMQLHIYDDSQFKELEDVLIPQSQRSTFRLTTAPMSSTGSYATDAVTEGYGSNAITGVVKGASSLFSMLH